MGKQGHSYLSGRYSFERLFGDLAKGKRTWQSVAFLALLVNLVLSAGYVYLASQHKGQLCVEMQGTHIPLIKQG